MYGGIVVELSFSTFDESGVSIVVGRLFCDMGGAGVGVVVDVGVSFDPDTADWISVDSLAVSDVEVLTSKFDESGDDFESAVEPVVVGLLPTCILKYCQKYCHIQYGTVNKIKPSILPC